MHNTPVASAHHAVSPLNLDNNHAEYIRYHAVQYPQYILSQKLKIPFQSYTTLFRSGTKSEPLRYSIRFNVQQNEKTFHDDGTPG